MARSQSMKLLGAGTVLGLLGIATPSAHAIDSVTFGVLQHNIAVLDGKNADKEDGPALEAQVTFKPIEALSWAGSPQPYVSLSPNVSGDTSFAAVGLQWRVRLGSKWSIEPSFGYAVHDGEVSNPFRNGDPRATAFTDEHVLLGSRDLFRSGIGVSRQVGETWSAQAFYVHYSHGQILGEGRNQGMDQLGLRFTRHFD